VETTKSRIPLTLAFRFDSEFLLRRLVEETTMVHGMVLFLYNSLLNMLSVIVGRRVLIVFAFAIAIGMRVGNRQS
jgi:hypothetical protein